MDFEDFLPYAFSLILALPFLILFRQFFYRFLELKKKELQYLSTKTNQAKLQAAERMILFLERIKPSNLVQKFDKDLNPNEYIFLLEKSIVTEFEYNVSQQLYITKETWEELVLAKNEIRTLIRSTYENLSQEATLKDFKMVFLMNYVSGQDYLSEVIQSLKRDHQLR